MGSIDLLDFYLTYFKNPTCPLSLVERKTPAIYLRHSKRDPFFFFSYSRERKLDQTFSTAEQGTRQHDRSRTRRVRCPSPQRMPSRPSSGTKNCSETRWMLSSLGHRLGSWRNRRQNGGKQWIRGKIEEWTQLTWAHWPKPIRKYSRSCTIDVVLLAKEKCSLTQIWEKLDFMDFWLLLMKKIGAKINTVIAVLSFACVRSTHSRGEAADMKYIRRCRFGFILMLMGMFTLFVRHARTVRRHINSHTHTHTHSTNHPVVCLIWVINKRRVVVN